MALSEVLFSVLGIVAVVGLGSLAVVIVLDMLLVLFAPERYGVIFHRQKRSERVKNQSQKVAKIEDIVEKVEKHPTKVKETAITTYDMPTITPFLDLQQMEETHKENLEGVDFDKAVEEQKLIQSKNAKAVKEVKKQEPLFTTSSTNAKASPMLFDEEEEEDVEEESEEITDLIKEVQEAAMKEIVEEDLQKENIIKKELSEVNLVSNKQVTEEDVKNLIVSDTELNEEVVEEKQPVKIKTLRPKLIFKQVTEKIIQKEIIVQAPPAPVEPVAIVAPVVEEVEHKPTASELKQQESDINEIRKIREDIFNLRVNAFKDLKSSKNGVVSEEKQQEVLELEENIREKLKELDSLKQYKITVESEKEQLIKFNQEVKEENSKLVKELEGLETELHTLKSTVGIEDKPYFTKEYYEGYLADLELQLTDVDKELRRNKREFYPLRRIKKTFDQDVVKLRRKEALVAKQKLKIYGVNNVEDIDPDKMKKLEEEVEILTNLKDSVRSCEIILKQNKDRYPVLERENALLIKHVETLKKDIQSIKKAISYYEAQEAKVAKNEFSTDQE